MWIIWKQGCNQRKKQLLDLLKTDVQFLEFNSFCFFLFYFAFFCFYRSYFNAMSIKIVTHFTFIVLERLQKAIFFLKNNVFFLLTNKKKTFCRHDFGESNMLTVHINFAIREVYEVSTSKINISRDKERH